MQALVGSWAERMMGWLKTEDVKLQESAAAQLRRYAGLGHVHRSNIMKVRPVLPLVEILKREDRGPQEHAIAVLTLLLQDRQDHYATVVEADPVPGFVRALSHADPAGRAEAAGALTTLMGTDARNVRVVGAAGTIPSFVNVLKHATASLTSLPSAGGNGADDTAAVGNHTHPRVTQERVCVALDLLTLLNTEQRRAFCASSGAAAVVAVLASTSSLVLRERALKVLLIWPSAARSTRPCWRLPTLYPYCSQCLIRIRTTRPTHTSERC